jgi:hypothetical protein
MSLLNAIRKLNQSGLHLRVIDMDPLITRKHFDAETFIKNLDAPIFAVEADVREKFITSLELADTIKKQHPGSRSIFFGYAAAAFNEQIMAFPQVDGILLTELDGTNSSQLIEASDSGKFGKVSGLVWKEKRGKFRQNELSEETSSNMLDISALYTGASGLTLRQNLSGGKAVLRRLLSDPVITISGGPILNHNIDCKTIVSGASPASIYRNPEDVYHDIVEISRFSPQPILISGDITGPGDHFAERLLSLLQHKPVPNPLRFELLDAVQPFLIQEIARSAPRFQLIMTPGWHDEAVRVRFGASYSNSQMETTISEALRAGTGGIELRFLVGLPGQTAQSIFETTVYCEYLLRLFDGDRRLSLSIAPFTPPSYAGFRELDACGFSPRYSNFEEYLNAMKSPSWSDGLEYCTPQMSSSELALATYVTLTRLVRLKAKYGQTTLVEAERSAAVYERGMEMIRRIAKFERNASSEELNLLRPEITNINRLSGRTSPVKSLPLAFSRPQNMAAAARALAKDLPWRRRS